jgi:hypothetical protein
MMDACATCVHHDVDADQPPCATCCSPTNNYVAMLHYKSFPEKPTTGVKYDNDKPQWSLLPFKALREVVEVLTYGAKKYAPDNWKKVPNAKQRYIDAGFRHFTAYASGEKHDQETGKHHLAHAICCMLYLVAFDLGEHNDKSNSDI